MSPFGPFYPSVLQKHVNHAERLARAVTRACAKRAHHAVSSAELLPEELWMLGRAEEIELFVTEVVGSWRRGTDARRAALAIESYLDHLHRGYVAMAIDALPCCEPCAVTVDVDVVGVR